MASKNRTKKSRKTARDHAPPVEVTDSNGHLDLSPDEYDVVIKKARRMYLDNQSRQHYEAMFGDEFVAPPEQGYRLEDELEAGVEPVTYLIDGLFKNRGNTLCVARKKAGKTTLGLNACRSLITGKPFLRKFGTDMLDGDILFLNHEVDRSQFDAWSETIGVPTDRILPIHLRGQAFPFWLPHVRDLWVPYIKREGFELLVVDPASESWPGIVQNENDNTAIRNWTRMLDRFCFLSGIKHILAFHHMGHNPGFEDQEHGRGASGFEGWSDSNWYYTTDSQGTRFLRADGRDTNLPATSVNFDPATRELWSTGESRTETKQGRWAMEITRALDENDGSNTSALEEACKKSISKGEWPEAIRHVVSQGYVERRNGKGDLIAKDDWAQGGGPKICFLTDAGRRMLGRAENGAGSSSGGTGGRARARKRRKRERAG